MPRHLLQKNAGYDAHMHTRAAILLFLCIALSCGLLYSRVGAQTVVDSASSTVSASVASIPSIDDDTGGGGGSSQSGVQFSGFAYPGATVTLMHGSEKLLSTIADGAGKFSIVFSDVEDAPQLMFSLFALDSAQRRSTLLNFPVIFYTGQLTDIRNIRFAPTITTDKVAIKTSDFITVEGAALPRLPMNVIFEGNDAKTFTLSAGAEGAYRLTVPLALPQGEYIVKARYEGDTRTSAALRLIVGNASIPRVEVSANIPGDCNLDQKVTIVDFSVLAFWFGKKQPPSCVDTNGDGAITLVDFSILAFYWNG